MLAKDIMALTCKMTCKVVVPLSLVKTFSDIANHHRSTAGPEFCCFYIGE